MFLTNCACQLPHHTMAAKTTTSDSGAEKMAEARKRNLDAAISQIQKEFGESAIMRMGDDRRMDVEVIPTGNLLIDRALGVGGVPRGRIIEVFGPESSGKTTLTLTVIAQAQKRGGLAAMKSMTWLRNSWRRLACRPWWASFPCITFRCWMASGGAMPFAM